MSMYGNPQKERLYESIEYARYDYESFWQFVADLVSILERYLEYRDCYEEESE